MPKRTVFCFAFAAALLGFAASTALALTPQQVVQRCQSAYNALRTYQGTVTVSATSGAQNLHATARIVFVRPGKIRASGSDIFGGAYAYVSNGTDAYQKQGGAWSKCDSAELAVAGATGTAQSAATTVPSLLLHISWGDPFSGLSLFSPTVGEEKVDGHVCYRLTAATALGSKTVWIDAQTFLLRRLLTVADLEQTPLHQDQHIVNGPLNASVPAGTFTPNG